MKSISYNLGDTKVHAAISEQQILELQDYFLTPGFHTISVSSIEEGRSLIYSFLDALRCYHHVGCLTDYRQPRKKIWDIYQYLSEYGYLNAYSEYKYDTFFLEELEVDFLWIEPSTTSAYQTLREHFISKISFFNFDMLIPVIFFSLSQEKKNV